MADIKEEKQSSLLVVAQDVYEYSLASKGTTDALVARAISLKEKIIDLVLTEHMADYYVQLCATYTWDADLEKVASMKAINEAKLAEIALKIEDATKNAGETEVLDGMFLKARYLSQIGDFALAQTAFDEIIIKKKISSGKKIDATLDKLRISLFLNDLPQMKTYLADAKELIEIGGDWDRRNRVKVYEALYCLFCRDFKKASSLLIDCIATFNCPELLSYEHFMFLAVISSLISLDRITLHKKIISNPEVISVTASLPKVKSLMHTLYNCDYEGFFQSIYALHEQISNDRYLGAHATFIFREYRVLAYSQFLEAYRSVMLSSMARSFGIPPSYLDVELSRFIASGRLSAKIDKVGDIVETTRPDSKNLQYQGIIKKGDVLLNRIQKLARVINV